MTLHAEVRVARCIYFTAGVEHGNSESANNSINSHSMAFEMASDCKLASWIAAPSRLPQYSAFGVGTCCNNDRFGSMRCRLDQAALPIFWVFIDAVFRSRCSATRPWFHNFPCLFRQHENFLKSAASVAQVHASFVNLGDT